MPNDTRRISTNNGKAPSPPSSLLFLRTNSEDAHSSQLATRNRSSYDIATIIAATQLVEHQELYGSDALPPKDVFGSWLEENREHFIEARRVGRNLNASGPKRNLTGPRLAQEPLSAHPVSLLNRPPGPEARGKRPKHKTGDRQEDSNATGICRRMQKCRRQVCGMGKRVGRFLGRARRVVRPSGGEKQTQLVASEKEVVHKNDNSDGLFQDGEENPISQEQRGATSASDRDSTMPPPQGFSQDRPQFLPLERIEDQSMITTTDEPYPSTPRRGSFSSNTTTLRQSEREAAPSPPEQVRPFHISQVAHLAPTHIAAERSRARALLEGHQSHHDSQVFGSSEINTNANGNKVVQYNGPNQRQDQNRNDSSLAHRDALRARIRDAAFLSGELWFDGLSGGREGRMGLRFVARPLRNTGGKISASRRGSGLLPTVGGRKTYGLSD
ncbi:hypothetical protein K449DRAFT_217390 [Hypoxylon sp. EC38]|nr:hypothetical protein K449DRAFT_217390 [Hypoxylon sp. EC38]